MCANYVELWKRNMYNLINHFIGDEIMTVKEALTPAIEHEFEKYKAPGYPIFVS